jgi:hypothetical protein
VRTREQAVLLYLQCLLDTVLFLYGSYYHTYIGPLHARGVSKLSLLVFPIKAFPLTGIRIKGNDRFQPSSWLPSGLSTSPTA